MVIMIYSSFLFVCLPKRCSFYHPDGSTTQMAVTYVHFNSILYEQVSQSPWDDRCGDHLCADRAVLVQPSDTFVHIVPQEQVTHPFAFAFAIGLKVEQALLPIEFRPKHAFKRSLGCCSTRTS